MMAGSNEFTEESLDDGPGTGCSKPGEVISV